MKLTTTISYTLKFQVAGEGGFFGPECDTLQQALTHWDAAMSTDSSIDWVITAYVTKEIK